jgi:hypothetical protein
MGNGVSIPPSHVRPGPTSDSNFLNSASFCALYSSISLAASVRASLSFWTRSGVSGVGVGVGGWGWRGRGWEGGGADGLDAGGGWGGGYGAERRGRAAVRCGAGYEQREEHLTRGDDRIPSVDTHHSHWRALVTTLLASFSASRRVWIPCELAAWCQLEREGRAHHDEGGWMVSTAASAPWSVTSDAPSDGVIPHVANDTCGLPHSLSWVRKPNRARRQCLR